MQYKYPNGSYVVLVGIVIAGLANQYMKVRNHSLSVSKIRFLGKKFWCHHSSRWVGFQFLYLLSCRANLTDGSKKVTLWRITVTELFQSMMIPNALYNSMWYRVPVRLQKVVLMIITRSQRPMELHAAPIGVMSHELFITVSQRVVQSLKY